MPFDESTTAELILPLTADVAPLSLVGGKARALMQLSRAGLPVPSGFCIATVAYQAVLEDAGLRALLEAHGTEEARATELYTRIVEAAVPEPIETAIRSAYAALGSGEHGRGIPVAVRSSATAEDLPELSFAGQQDSFLNVIGADAVLAAVRRCWASLYAETAIGYRLHMGVAEIPSMAVVVQRLVDAQTAGVLFTADPTSGDRGKLIVNGSWGLGESVVSGTVAADAWVLDRASRRPVQHVPGTKAERVVPLPGGGTESEPAPESQRQAPCLTDGELVRLAGLGLDAESLLCGPQDVEWALADGRFWLLQSRPITGLPPPPAETRWEPPAGVGRLMRRQVVENMPSPLSPLFESLYLTDVLDRGLDELFAEMNLPMRIGDFIHTPMFVTVNGYGYNRYDLKPGWHWLAMLPKILWFYVTGLPRLVRTIEERWALVVTEYAAVIDRWRAVPVATASDGELYRGVRELAVADARYWGYITMMVGAAKITEMGLAGFLKSRFVRAVEPSAAYLRGYPSRTRTAQEELEALAREVASDRQLHALVAGSTPETLLTTLARIPEGRRIAERLSAHLVTYGDQVFDLDFVEPTLAERPEIVLAGFAALVANPPLPGRREEMAVAREVLVEETAASLGPIRRRLFRMLLRWAQRFAPYREEALFYMGAGWTVLRRLALALGERLVAAGALAAADDLFFLSGQEIEAACAAGAVGDHPVDLSARAAERRALREARKRLHPPARVPEDLRFRIGPFDITRFFETFETQRRNRNDSDTLAGFAVSPGRVTAPASVVKSREDFAAMRPNSVLVCPTTTPAWTPLFAQAVGLVTDIGSVLAHGSIVAREYGIPAVLGTGNATERIRDGAVITVDGDAGEVLLATGGS